MSKRYITANELLEDAFTLAIDILDSGFRPSFIVAVWRGGTPIGIAVQEVLELCGVQTRHIAVRTSSYSGIDQREKQVRVHGLAYVIDTINSDDSLLIIDDVHDSGRSVAELIRQIKTRADDRAPAEIKVATIYYKPGRSEVIEKPDYYLHETDDWLVFPHELAGLSMEELREQKPGVSHMLDKLTAYID